MPSIESRNLLLSNRLDAMLCPLSHFTKSMKSVHGIEQLPHWRKTFVDMATSGTARAHDHHFRQSISSAMFLMILCEYASFQSTLSMTDDAVESICLAITRNVSYVLLVLGPSQAITDSALIKIWP